MQNRGPSKKQHLQKTQNSKNAKIKKHTQEHKKHTPTQHKHTKTHVKHTNTQLKKNTKKKHTHKKHNKYIRSISISIYIPTALTPPPAPSPSLSKPQTATANTPQPPAIDALYISTTARQSASVDTFHHLLRVGHGRPVHRLRELLGGHRPPRPRHHV